MQQINHWPDIKELADITLPKTVSQDLLLRLLKPFDSEQEANEFWLEAPTTIIILNPTDDISEIQLSDAWNDIEFALTYTEYDVPLKNDYVLLVAIANDGGSAINLVIPPDLSHIIKETVSTTT